MVFTTATPRGISSVGRALQWHCRGRGFESLILHFGNDLRQDSLSQFNRRLHNPVFGWPVPLSAFYRGRRSSLFGCFRRASRSIRTAWEATRWSWARADGAEWPLGLPTPKFLVAGIVDPRFLGQLGEILLVVLDRVLADNALHRRVRFERR